MFTKKFKIEYYHIIFFAFLTFTFFFFNLAECLTDTDFVILIKNMAIKNHNDPTLFQKVYNEAQTEELKYQKYLTNQFYECVYHNKDKILTKEDINHLCGNFIKFK